MRHKSWVYAVQCCKYFFVVGKILIRYTARLAVKLQT